MIRAAAKNHDDVAVVVEAADYQAVLDELAANKGATSLTLRRRLAAKAYARTAAYDAAISNWFALQLKDDAPDFRAFGGKLIQSLRYGENPHQTAAFYATPDKRPGVSPPRGSLQGKELSYNNINDTDAAYECVGEFDPARTAACVIVKHANPCGVAEGADLLGAYQARRWPAIPRRPSAASSRSTARSMPTPRAPSPKSSPKSSSRPMRPKKPSRSSPRRRICGCCWPAACPIRAQPGLTAKTVAGGLLVQSRDNAVVEDMALKVATKRAPTDAELRDLKFAFRVAKHVKSNTIIYAKDLATVGIGAGQMSRVDSARIAARKALDAAAEMKLAEPLTKGSVVASDAFFPFADGMLACIEAGATAVIQPGGSMRDDEVIKAADDARHRHGVHRRAAFPALMFCRPGLEPGPIHRGLIG